jgi:AcrR family transcriptional regulator
MSRKKTQRSIVRKVQTKKTLIRDPEMLKKRRAAIAKVAFALFLRHGYHNTSVREIADEASISVGALFTYFTTKDDILFYIIDYSLSAIERAFENVKRDMDTLIMAGVQPDRVMAVAVISYCRFIDETKHFTLLAYQETKSLIDSARKLLFDRERHIISIFEEVIRYGIRQKVWVAQDTAVLAHSIIVLGQAWAVRRWFLLSEVDSVDDYATKLLSFVLGMLRGAPGNEVASLIASIRVPDKAEIEKLLEEEAS